MPIPGKYRSLEAHAKEMGWPEDWWIVKPEANHERPDETPEQVKKRHRASRVPITATAKYLLGEED